jgi:uncharacterized DUF497 family protein
MNFEWDDQKNQANILRHGLDFADGHKVFDEPLLINLDDREDYGEDRWIGIGVFSGRVVVIVFTERGEDTIRIISFRKATGYERKRYELAYQNEFGTS